MPSWTTISQKLCPGSGSVFFNVKISIVSQNFPEIFLIPNLHMQVRSGADLGFSRGGADFQKIFENFVDLFFRSTKLIFRALPKHCFAPILAKFSAPQAKF